MLPSKSQTPQQLLQKLLLFFSAGTLLTLALASYAWLASLARANERREAVTPNSARFVVVAGGGAPSYNEIALEKNVLYFQRTLAELGQSASDVDIFFANGNDGQSTVRYINFLGRERFKPPEIAHLRGAATAVNLDQWFQQTAKQPPCQRFFYFTGHGLYNETNPDNNSLILWKETLFDVQDLAARLDRLPPEQPFVAMMAQCYAGAFANLIYEGGDPSQPVALQSRCGFFATVASRPSVGCTPAVNEADYRDYSSSFFAGLSGVDRVGQPVASADYDANGVIAYNEAHAFAKVDEETADWPISTVEAWLQRQATPQDTASILSLPLANWVAVSPPQRRYVIESLAAKLGYDLSEPYPAQERPVQANEVQVAYRMRLEMELINVGITQKIQTSGSDAQLSILNQLTECEASSLSGPRDPHDGRILQSFQELQ
ncbi:MAG: Caspase domain-containing protein [Cyanobacteria bacterium J06628_6]